MPVTLIVGRVDVEAVVIIAVVCGDLACLPIFLPYHCPVAPNV
jgi:hypothetical protein